MSDAASHNHTLSTAIADVSNVVIQSTREAFLTMMDVSIERKFLKLVDRDKPLFSITSVISLTGDMHGCICLSMTTKTAMRAAEKMLGMEFDHVDELVSSTVSEFSNIIAGSAKNKLEHMNLTLGLPNVIRGNEYHIDFPKLSQPICVSFSSDIGQFLLVFGFTDQ